MEEKELKKTFYDDVGICHEFVLLADDVWKKEEIFINFAVRLVRMIALEVGVPVEYIGYGKWGARITWEDEADDKVKEWVDKIESHKTYLDFKEVCKFATYRKEGSEEQEHIFEYMDCVPVLKVDFRLKETKSDAKQYLSMQEYKKFLRGLNQC